MIKFIKRKKLSNKIGKIWFFKIILIYEFKVSFGKFVYFCWGDKINPKEFSNISDYARTIYENCVKSGKKIAFAYKKEKTVDESIKYLQFSNPMQNHKNKNSISFAIKRSFDTFPPTPAFYE